MTDIPGLDKLPSQISALAGAVPQAGISLVRASIDRLLDPVRGFPTLHFMNEARLAWRFYLAQKESEIFFFFIREDSPVDVVLDTNISFRVAAVSRTDQPTPITAESISKRIVLPPFIKTQPSAQELRDFAPQGAKWENTLFLTLGPQRQNLLAVMNPKKHNLVGITEPDWWPKLRYSPNGVPGAIEPDNGKYSLKPFLDLTETLRSWVKNGFDVGPDMPFDVDSLGYQSDVKHILKTIIKAYSEALSQVRMGGTNQSKLLLALVGEYEVLDFQARVVLRLRPDGSIASDNKQDPFQLLMLVWMIQEQEKMKTRVAIGPPDFLVSGALYEAFLEALQQKEALTEIATLLNSSSEEVNSLLRAFAKSGVIFRIKREDDGDTDILVLPGVDSGKNAALMLRGKFVVDAAKDPPRVELKKNTIRNLLFNEPNRESPSVESEAVKYFFRLFDNIKRWIGVLQ
jgi:hypothetical protein